MSIPIACIGVLIEAYYRTDYHDADTSWDAQFIPSNDCIDSYNGNACSTATVEMGSSSNMDTTSTTATASTTNGTCSSNTYTGTNRIVQTLERDGIVIIPNAISPTILYGARDNILCFQQPQPQTALNKATGEIWKNHTDDQSPYRFATSGNDADVRQDKIIWIRNGSSNATSSSTTDTTGGGNNALKEYSGNLDSDHDLVEEASQSTEHTNEIGRDLEYCINFVRGIPYALEKNGYTLSTNHQIPKQCQLSMYTGDNISSYQRHLDTCTASIYDLGLLEYLRLSDYRQRRITIILYLNDSHRPISHGGSLRCWVSNELSNGNPLPLPSSPEASSLNTSNCTNDTTDNSGFHPSFDILPTGGTLVIFQSER
jgi:hypothetical protein